MATEVQPRYEEEKELLRWRSVERPFKTQSKEFFSTVLVLAVLVGIILFFIEGIMPVLVVAAIVFVIFVLGRTEPVEVEHVITNKGVITGGRKYDWEGMRSFWFSDKWGREVVHLLTRQQITGQIMMVLPEKGLGREKLKEVLLAYLPLEKPEDSALDKTVKWLGEKLPLDEG